MSTHHCRHHGDARLLNGSRPDRPLRRPARCGLRLRLRAPASGLALGPRLEVELDFGDFSKSRPTHDSRAQMDSTIVGKHVCILTLSHIGPCPEIASGFISDRFAYAHITHAPRHGEHFCASGPVWRRARLQARADQSASYTQSYGCSGSTCWAAAPSKPLLSLLRRGRPRAVLSGTPPESVSRTNFD